MRKYIVAYRMYQFDTVKYILVEAKSKADAYSKAVFEAIPELTNEQPYSAWVDRCITRAGKIIIFNTCEGLAY